MRKNPDAKTGIIKVPTRRSSKGCPRTDVLPVENGDGQRRARLKGHVFSQGNGSFGQVALFLCFSQGRDVSANSRGWTQLRFLMQVAEVRSLACAVSSRM